MKQNRWLIIVLLGLLTVGGTYVVLTRGFRNNNPGNLRGGIPWVGYVGLDSEGYAMFDTLANGIRAMGLDLLTKMGRGVNTISSILDVYAPPSDNNPTYNYKVSVANETGLDMDQPLSRADMPAVASAMIYFENGHHAPAGDFEAGMKMALAA